MPGKIKTNCYLLKKQPYSESSILMQVFSDSLGLISVLAKGMRKSKQHQDYLLNILNEYEMIVTEASPSGIHTLTELALSTEYRTDLPFETWAVAQSGAELLTKLILPHDDIPQYYLALKKYLAYLPVITKNPIAVFWRFVIHICQLLGVPINLNKCSQCQNPIEKPSGYSAETGQLICSACQKAMAVSYEFSPEASRIVMLLPVIGNFLNDLDITKENIKQINHFFLHYISQQFHKNIYLKSLQALE